MGVHSPAAIAAGEEHSLALLPMAPRLFIQKEAPDAVVISWSSKARNWSLEQSDALTVFNWVGAAGATLDDGTNVSVTIGSLPGRQFFRLIKQ